MAKHLTLEKRDRIAHLKSRGFIQAAIAKALGRKPSVVFVEISLGDTSDFFQEPVLDIRHEVGRHIIRVSRCTSIAPAIAALALSLTGATKPIELHVGWSEESPLKMNLGFLLFGEGNIPFLVKELLQDAQPDESLRPRVIIG